jgi:ABC-2 type transport system permease protein
MSARITLAVAERVLRQLRHDPRTIGLLMIVPSALLVLVRYVLDDPAEFERVGIPMMGLFPLITMFLATSITMLRERTTGTLERLMTLPLAKLDLLLGYAIAFGAVATLQAALVSTIGFTWLDLDPGHSTVLVVALAVANGLLGMAMGLLISAFASTEFQVVQFMPAIIFPQILLCGLFAPRDTMQPLLEYISNVLPMSYAVDGMNEVLQHTDPTGDFVRDAVIVAGSALLVLFVGAGTLRRRTP